MDLLHRLPPEALARVEQSLLNAEPGSRIGDARHSGTDLTLLVEQLRLTPDERVRKLERASTAFEQIRGAALESLLEAQR